MYRHHPHTLCALLDNGCILGLTGFCIVFHTIDESAEGGSTTLLETPRQVDQPKAVGQRLLACRPHRNARVRPDRIEQHQYSLGDGPTVAVQVEATHQVKCICDLLCSRLKLVSIDRVHRMESAYLQVTIVADCLPVDEQGVVAKRE